MLSNRWPLCLKYAGQVKKAPGVWDLERTPKTTGARKIVAYALCLWGAARQRRCAAVNEIREVVRYERRWHLAREVPAPHEGNRFQGWAFARQ
jgi:hypothetical protein